MGFLSQTILPYLPDFDKVEVGTATAKQRTFSNLEFLRYLIDFEVQLTCFGVLFYLNLREEDLLSCLHFKEIELFFSNYWTWNVKKYYDRELGFLEYIIIDFHVLFRLL